jgi:hypothetical protein
VRRTIDQAFEALRAQISNWAKSESRADLRVFVYPPEWESLVLHRLPQLAEELAAKGALVELEDVGQGFLHEIERRKGLEERLMTLERDELLHDLGQIASGYLRRTLMAPLEPPTVCRILTNTGTLGAFVSYSSITNELSGGPGGEGPPASVLAFPGEGDDRSLNLLGLRVDTNYRVARI